MSTSKQQSTDKHNYLAKYQESKNNRFLRFSNKTLALLQKEIFNKKQGQENRWMEK